eukprot:95506-Rhodomonas_salina.1
MSPSIFWIAARLFARGDTQVSHLDSIDLGSERSSRYQAICLRSSNAAPTTHMILVAPYAASVPGVAWNARRSLPGCYKLLQVFVLDP